MITPPPRPSIWRAACWQSTQALTRATFSTFVDSSRGVSRGCSTLAPRPALFTRIRRMPLDGPNIAAAGQD